MNLSHLPGLRLPGGCPDCDAYQTFTQDPEAPGVIHLTVHHDDHCPALARKARRR